MYGAQNGTLLSSIYSYLGLWGLLVALCILALHRLGLDGNSSTAEDASAGDPPLRPCQKQCLEACAKGARVIEMACGTGKTRVIKEIVKNISGRAP